MIFKIIIMSLLTVSCAFDIKNLPIPTSMVYRSEPLIYRFTVTYDSTNNKNKRSYNTNKVNSLQFAPLPFFDWNKPSNGFIPNLSQNIEQTQGTQQYQESINDKIYHEKWFMPINYPFFVQSPMKFGNIKKIIQENVNHRIKKIQYVEPPRRNVEQRYENIFKSSALRPKTNANKQKPYHFTSAKSPRINLNEARPYNVAMLIHKALDPYHVDKIVPLAKLKSLQSNQKTYLEPVQSNHRYFPLIR